MVHNGEGTKGGKKVTTSEEVGVGRGSCNMFVVEEMVAFNI